MLSMSLSFKNSPYKSHFHKIFFDNNSNSGPGANNLLITKRRLPYPYKAALTICNDIDSTNTLEQFLAIQEFLNTKNKTIMGEGLGLEIGNSFYPIRNKHGAFALMSQNPSDKEVIIDLIKLGYIDSIHSFNAAENREKIHDIVNFLHENKCKLEVWVNHSIVSSNIGPLKSDLGDKIDSEHYHTDISIKKLGYKFVWMYEVSNIIGQGRPLHLRSFFSSLDRRHFFQSLYNNVLKEICKYILAFVHWKYADRKYNDLIYPVQLSDGQWIFKFIRSDAFYGGIGPGANSEGLSSVLREDILNELKKSEGYMIVYTHLGKHNNFPYISKDTQKALRSLEREYRTGNIYVTTTGKLLNYYVNSQYLKWNVEKKKEKTYIKIEEINDPVRGSFIPSIDDLRGITFYTNDPESTHIFIQDKEISEMVINGLDFTGRKSVMIPLKPLPSLEYKINEYKKKGYLGPWQQ